ncbi:MAG TPA: oligosaccharide flippase family protein [Flavobacterium sp.]|jgi:O-antigen/teichoic acid export membrane protein
MGIVINQSIKNTVITYIGFLIGAANALFMYTNFLGKTYYGLTAFLLSSANIMMPLMAFGVHNTLVKFYSGYKTEEEKSTFLSFVMLLPLLLIVPIGIIGYFAYEQIADFLSEENPIIHDFVWLIPVIGLLMGYFEIFYAWVKVHMLSVYGSFLKEVFLRVLISLFLFAVYFKYISVEEFIYITVGIYFTATFAMAIFAFRVRRPTLTLRFPSDKKAIFIYSVFIIISGSVAVLLLDIDKFMLGQYIRIDNVAYYSVAIFIATVVSVPSRAMHQITYPITAKLMSENKHDELNALYKKTSVTLQVVGGLVLVGILVNVTQLYELIPREYSGGIFVVFAIGASKYIDLLLGNNNAIIFNSKYYRMVLFLGLMLAVLAITLNMYFIPRYGIDGAAIATLISLILYNAAKLLFVIFRMDLNPFTIQTLYSFVIFVLTFGVFYYWEFSFHPIINIVLKSALVSVFYLVISYKLKISPDINSVINAVLKKVHLVK